MICVIQRLLRYVRYYQFFHDIFYTGTKDAKMNSSMNQTLENRVALKGHQVGAMSKNSLYIEKCMGFYFVLSHTVRAERRKRKKCSLYEVLDVKERQIWV